MKKKFISFSLAYWLVFIIILLFICYSDGKERLSDYDFTNGVVVDKLILRSPWGSSRYGGRGGDLEFAQWQYIVNEDTFLFVDKQKFTYNKPTGTQRRIIYLKHKTDEALVYSFQFWINTPLILIVFMIAFFIFSIGQFARHWNDRSWFSKWR
jgi:hypothetical protein